MGLLDSILGAALGGNSGGGGNPQADLLRNVIGMLGNDGPGGGLAGLVQQFEQGGLGEVVQSWIASGHNLPVSADQLRNVLGNDRLGALAQQLGLSHGQTADQLAQVLPQLVDHLTPGGQMPAGGLGDMAELLGTMGIR
ncbi:MAG: DUF937 domain-containing protein [Burkholderiales bacterium]|nr:DUF937 domain-containing protein [Burkholderiales bacterium]